MGYGTYTNLNLLVIKKSSTKVLGVRLLLVWIRLTLSSVRRLSAPLVFLHLKAASYFENLLIWYKPQLIVAAGLRTQREWSLSHDGHASFPPAAPTSISPADDSSMSEIPASTINVGGLGTYILLALTRFCNLD